MTSPDSPPALVTRGDVAKMLGLPLRKLTWWLWGIHDHRRYEEFEIPRRTGGQDRQISAPIKPLKDLQRKLASILADTYRPSANVHGFVHGRGPTSNARIHRRQEWLLRLDLEDFFPTINFGRVLGLFRAYPFEYPHDVAAMLAQLCCHHNQLPQGAPTSPVISNLICRGLDKELGALARSERSFYSRYADDICFSTDRRTFPAALARRTSNSIELGEPIVSVISANGFAINHEKSFLLRRTQRQRVTGLVVNKKVNVSRDYVRSLRNLLFIWRTHGREAAEAAFDRASPERGWPPEKDAPDFTLVIRGRVQHVGSIKGRGSPVYRKLAEALREVDPAFQIPAEATPIRQKVRLFTEGETDISHMLAAQRYFSARNEFLDFELKAAEHSVAGNDSELLKRCRTLGDTAESPCICLFDTDNPEVIRKAIGSQGWKRWGSNCIAVGLVPPAWLDDNEPICIELLFDNATLQIKDSNGRRVFLRREFDKRTGIHSEHSDITIPNARNRTLVQEEVHDRDGASIGMTKADFAESVAAGDAPYQGISFEGFRPTFEAINEAVLAMKMGPHPRSTTTAER
jgi:RNA-directed DNA polymerase